WSVTGVQTCALPISANGDPITLYGPTPTFTPPDSGNYTIQLTISDGDGGEKAVVVGSIHVANTAPVVLGTLEAPAGPLSEGQTSPEGRRVGKEGGGV